MAKGRQRERKTSSTSYIRQSSGNVGSLLPCTGQDWTNWLRHARDTQLPRTPSPSGRIEAVWAGLTHLARRKGFAIQRGNCAAADGFTTWRNRRIRIRPDATPAHAVIALAHQLGHVLLHAPIAVLEPSGTVPCTGIRQVEADSVAYLAATHIGIDATTITFPHVSSWAGTDPRAQPAATIQAVTARILAATATIAACLDAAVPVGAPPLAAARSAVAEVTGQLTGPQASQAELVRVHDSAASFFRSQMPGSWVPRYLASRGLTPANQDHWQAGYAPAAWDALIRHLRAAGYPDPVIEAAGLARRSRRGTLIDTFRDRAMLPIRSAEGTVVAFTGRAAPHADPDVPKYLNSPATSLYDKGAVLFGLWEARGALATGARPVIVEGPLDAIAVTTAGHGRYIGVAPCGTALTARHAAALGHAADLRATGVTVAFDPDNAGRRAAVRAYHLLVPLTDKMAAVTLPAGQDPAQILAASGPATLAAMLASHGRPLPDVAINAEICQWTRRRLRYPEGQIGALRAAAPLIAAMPPVHVARQVARLAAILRLDHAIVTEAVTDALTALVTDRVASPGGTTAHQTDRRGLPQSGVRVADSPHSAQQAIAHTTADAPTPARNNPASTGQPRLTSRRVPG